MTYWILENLGTISLMESCTEDGVIIVDVRDLSDVETDVKKIQRKIETIAGLLAIGHKVVIRCVGGINRSNAIAIGVMTYLSPQGDLDTTWDFYWKIVKSVVPRMHITPNIERTIKKTLINIRSW